MVLISSVALFLLALGLLVLRARRERAREAASAALGPPPDNVIDLAQRLERRRAAAAGAEDRGRYLRN